MAGLGIETDFNGIHVSCMFSSQLNILNGFSGTGKSLLLQAVNMYCMDNGISCMLCDYRMRGISLDKIAVLCEGNDVLLLDNADLYLTDGLLGKLKQSARFIILSMKNTYGIDMSDMSEYLVNYCGRQLTLEDF